MADEREQTPEGGRPGASGVYSEWYPRVEGHPTFQIIPGADGDHLGVVDGMAPFRILISGLRTRLGPETDADGKPLRWIQFQVLLGSPNEGEHPSRPPGEVSP